MSENETMQPDDDEPSKSRLTVRDNKRATIVRRRIEDIREAAKLDDQLAADDLWFGRNAP